MSRRNSMRFAFGKFTNGMRQEGYGFWAEYAKMTIKSM